MQGYRDVDLAIRTARPTQGDMLVRKLGDLAYRPLCTPRPCRNASMRVLKSLVLKSWQMIPLIGFDEDALPTGPVWFLSRVEKTMMLVTRAAGDRARLQMVQGKYGTFSFTLHHGGC